VNPLVSVIVPLYESATTIGDTLGSLRAQSLTDWEAIVVDDGSTDDGPSIAGQIAASDQRIRVVHQPNRGLARARNTGLQHASGRFVYFLDADDWTEVRGIEKLVASCRSFEGAAYGAYQCRGASGEALGVTCWPSAHSVGLDELLEHNRFASHAQLIERRLLAGMKFNESLRVVEDYDFWIRLAERGVRWRAIDDVVASYRVRPGSLSKDFAAMFEAAAQVVSEGHERRAVQFRGSPELNAEHSTAQQRRNALNALAIEYWSASVIVGRRCDEGTVRRFFGAESREVDITADAAASAVYWAVVLGRGQRPDLCDPLAGEWIESAAAAWDTLEAMRRVRSGFCGAATAALAATLVSPERVARCILDRCRSGRVILVGLGCNGRAIVKCAQTIGRSLEVRDDNVQVARRTAEREAAGIVSQSMGAPIGRDDTVILSPTEVDGLVSRFQTHRVLSWSKVRDDLAQEELKRISVLLRRPPPAHERTAK